MKFFLSVFVVTVSLLALSAGTDAHTGMQHVITKTSEVFAHVTSPTIQPGDFLAD